MTELTAMLGQSSEKDAWDEQEQQEIIAYFHIDVDTCIDYEKEKAEISEGCCFGINNSCSPWRWEDKETALEAQHLAVSAHNVMFLTKKYPVHVLNPCPPCLCCAEGNYKEDFAPKSRKMIPIEKITDIELLEAGSNELVPPGCTCPPKCNPESIEIPMSKAMVNTAGGNGPELVISGISDATGFRRIVMDLKKGAGPGSAPGQMSMASAPLGNNSEVVQLLRDIAASNRQIAQALDKK